MNKRWSVLLAATFALAGCSALAEKPLKDYSFIRGVNYGIQGDQQTLERDLGYAKRVNLNSTRIWLSYQAYEKDPKGYIEKLRNYIRTSKRLGFSTMPSLFNGNSLTPDMLTPEFHQRGDAFAKAIVEAVKDEPGLLMWDIMNEPLWNDYFNNANGEDKKQHGDQITAFVRYYVTFVKKVDPANATTVGYAFSKELEGSADLVDVLTFHDYTPTRSEIEAAYKIAEDAARKYNKPLMNSETACIARANPYDVVLQIAEQHHTGWYLFNLIIQGYWGEVHGLFYPDGTVRDPAIISAIMGFYRNRNLDTMIRPQPNREGHAEKALKAIEDALKDDPNTFRHTTQPTDKLLDAAEYAANLLESSEMVPMIVPPSAQIQYWRDQPSEKRDRAAIRAFAYDLGLQLKKWCQLY